MNREKFPDLKSLVPMRLGDAVVDSQKGGSLNNSFTISPDDMEGNGNLKIGVKVEPTQVTSEVDPFLDRSLSKIFNLEDRRS